MMIYHCFKKLGADLDDIKRELAQIEEQYGERYEMLGWYAKKYSYKCTMSQGRYEDAIRECEAVIDEAPTEDIRLDVEVDIALLHEHLEDRVDYAGNPDEALLEIESRIDIAASGKVIALEQPAPERFNLASAYPNPFNSTTMIRFQLQQQDITSMKIFDVSGREVATILNGRMEAGYHSVSWDARLMPAGLYICRLQTGSESKNIKLMLVR